MNSSTVDCDIRTLKNKAKLYYQFNCDSIWLTLENNGQKKIIFSTDTELYAYTYRLGYQLEKEYKNSLLFKFGCSASIPDCSYILINKWNGKVLKKY
ncbi:MAG: hypothetical protein U0T77_04425 [Chitinophagales bacterium]